MTSVHGGKERPTSHQGRRFGRTVTRGAGTLWLAVLLAVAACGDSPSEPGAETPVAEVEMTPESFDLDVNEALDVQAVALSADGTPLAGRIFTWTSQDAAVATVSAGGRVTGVGPGTSKIHARAGGVTGTTTVTVRNPEAPPPEITALDPASVTAGSEAFVLTVTGAGFAPGARALWGGEARHTTWASASRLHVEVLRTDVADAGTAQVVVENPPFGGPASEPVTFTVTPVGSGHEAVISSFEPATVPAGSLGFTLTVRGSGFRDGATVLWNDSPRATTVVGPGDLSVQVAPQDVWEAGAQEVMVVNPESPGSVPRSYPVGPSGVASVAVSPHELVVDKGHAGTLLARPLAADLSPLEGRHVVWSSTNGNVVQVYGDGSYEATGAGTAKIRAQTADVWSEIDVLVRTLPVGTVTVWPGLSAILVEGSQILEVKVYDTAGEELVDHPVTWSSDHPAVATVDPDGRVTGWSKGLARIRAHAGDRTAHADVEVRQWPTGAVWTMDLRWPTATVYPTVGDTTWVDAGGTTRTGAVIFTGSTLVMDRAAGRYTQRFELHVVGLGEAVREESGTAGPDWWTGGFLFTPDTGGAERAFTAEPSGPAELRVRQAVGTAPLTNYLYVVR